MHVVAWQEKKQAGHVIYQQQEGIPYFAPLLSPSHPLLF